MSWHMICQSSMMAGFSHLPPLDNCSMKEMESTWDILNDTEGYLSLEDFCILYRKGVTRQQDKQCLTF